MTDVILLGTGTPNPDPFRAGPCVAVLYNEEIYIFDFGVGLVRRANEISTKLPNLKISNLKTAFLTHMHSDHTLGYPDLILTPWILGRNTPLKVFGPKGLIDMTNNLIKAYEIDIKQRINGLEQANVTGCKVIVEEISSGVVYTDQHVTVEAFPVVHGDFEAYGYKIITPDKVIVISGDTAPSDSLVESAKGCDILIHEVYYTKGLLTRSEQWQKYHSAVHTSAIELGKLSNLIKPKKLVLYHQLFMQENILDDDMSRNNEIYRSKIIDEIKENYSGIIIYGNDLDIIK